MGKRGGEGRRQVAGFVDDGAPFGQARVLVPVEVIDQRIALAGGRRRRTLFAGEGLVGMGNGDIDRGEQFRELVVLGDRRIERFIFVVDGLGVPDLGIRCVRLPYPAPQRLEADGRQRPAGRGVGDAPARAQHRVGAREFVGGDADVHAGVVQNEVLQVDELALDPERGGGVGKMRPRDPAVADGARSQPLVEPRQRVFGARQRPRELAPRQRIGKAGAQGGHREAGLGR